MLLTLLSSDNYSMLTTMAYAHNITICITVFWQYYSMLMTLQYIDDD
jgi:hypothetical protein